MQIPPELGQCEHLRALLIAGNPQRSIRVNTIQEGTEAVLKYLRNRLPPELQHAPPAPHVDTENIPPPNRSGTTARPRDAYSPMEKKRVRMTSTTPNRSSAGATTSVASASAAHASVAPPAPRTQAAPVAAASDAESSQALDNLNTKIVALEHTLEDFALTAAKRFAVKKELAMVRSQKIRLLRTLKP